MASRSKPKPTANDDSPVGEIEPTKVLHRFLKLHAKLSVPFTTHIEKQFAIGLNEYRFLILIGHLRTAAAHELSEITGISPMSASRTVRSLESAGRISLEEDPANRRRKLLRLTPEGQRFYRKMLPSAESVGRYLLGCLSPTEIEEFDRLVLKLIHGLDTRDEHGHLLFLEQTRPRS